MVIKVARRRVASPKAYKAFPVEAPIPLIVFSEVVVMMDEVSVRSAVLLSNENKDALRTTVGRRVLFAILEAKEMELATQHASQRGYVVLPNEVTSWHCLAVKSRQIRYIRLLAQAYDDYNPSKRKSQLIQP
jgi:hypothetical protein